jgi:hypothetical protein
MTHPSKCHSQLAITRRKLSELHPDPGNPRAHTPKQIKQIARSIETFGFNVPILIDGAGKVIAGHGRLLACQSLGWKDVPTITLAHLTPEQARAFMIADNRLTEISTWDDRLLGEQLKALSEVDLDFHLEVIGFEMAEIDLRIQGLECESGEEGPDPADDVPDPSPGPPVTRKGDIWLLGKHRLACGDALSESDVAALMAGRTASVVFADAPFNVPIEGHVCGNGKIHHRPFAMAVGEMSPEEFTAFLRKAAENLAAHSEDGSLHFLCMDHRHLRELLDAGHAVYSELKNLCVWVKDVGGMGSLYRSQHELVLVFKKGKEAHTNNVQLGRFGRNRSNVWRYPGVNSFARAKEEGDLLALHPTVKPVALVADILLDVSERGQIVLDTFLGSGTTILAAERTGRCCCGLELDPLYVDTAIRRWQAWTKVEATLECTGETFNKVGQRREAEVQIDQVDKETSHG